jgi:hypothetical protein
MLLFDKEGKLTSEVYGTVLKGYIYAYEIEWDTKPIKL